MPLGCIFRSERRMGGATLAAPPSRGLSSAGSVKTSIPVGAWRSLVARIVRDDEVGGSNPLAPTKLTNLAFKLDQARQRGVQSEVDRIRRELVLEALKPQNVESGEDRPDERLLAVGP